MLKSKLTLFFVLTVLIGFQGSFVHARSLTAQVNVGQPVLINVIASQLEAHSSKYSTVSITQLKRLSVNPSRNENINLSVGFSILTQKDITVKPGIGAIFDF